MEEKKTETTNAKDMFEDAMQNLKMEDLIRGKTPTDIEERCRTLCIAYIGGSWSNTTNVKDITVKRISGGLTNQLYHVRLNENIPRVHNPIYGDDEPVEVAIKLYQEKHMKNYAEDESERLNDIIVLTIISQVGIGPKVYGIFNDGVVLAYHKHEQFPCKTSTKSDIDNDWVFGVMRSMIQKGYETKDVTKLVEELNLEQFKRRDLKDEFENLAKYVSEYPTPKVFCHGDFRGSNILVLTDDPSKTDQIVLCDLEYSSYGARGYDMAVFLSEWGLELFDFAKFQLPDDDVFINFASLYVDEAERQSPGYRTKPENQISVIVREIKLFILVNFMFFLSFMIKQEEPLIAHMPYDVKTQMMYTNKMYSIYNTVKQQLIDGGVIKMD
ncbi:hypothetical protein BLOT_010143 [Blomia tropicalis]|nr:hypothetical protein BLOT_010143 [Blomia tropicalis]